MLTISPYLEARFESQDEQAEQHEDQITKFLQEIDTIKGKPVSRALPSHITFVTNCLLYQTPLEVAKGLLEEYEAKAKKFAQNRQNVLAAIQKNRKVCEKYQVEVKNKCTFAPSSYITWSKHHPNSRRATQGEIGACANVTYHSRAEPQRGGHPTHYE